MGESDFAYEFYSKIPDPNDELKDLAEHRLRALAKGHTDMVGASVAITELTHEETPNLYQARIVVYVRSTDIVATEKDPNPHAALKSAISAVERQVREQREKLGTKWKQP